LDRLLQGGGVGRVARTEFAETRVDVSGGKFAAENLRRSSTDRQQLLAGGLDPAPAAAVAAPIEIKKRRMPT
jgi:hypothetical protein